MTQCRIELENVHLSYPSSPYRTFSLKEVFFTWAKLQKPRPLVHDVHALKGLNLHIADGERLGIIGPNGSGKTTLLRAVAGIYPLSDGSIRTQGVVRSLFEINLGFEYEATGRENITYRGLLMGEKPALIKEKEEAIVQFTDIGEFIDYPVKTYSAGMLVRLAFSISTSFGSDILLLDEVLGAGDAAFMKKAKARMFGLISSARILVLVSHDLGSVKELCTRAIQLQEGRIVNDGPPEQVIDAYLSGLK